MRILAALSLLTVTMLASCKFFQLTQDSYWPDVTGKTGQRMCFTDSLKTHLKMNVSGHETEFFFDLASDKVILNHFPANYSRRKSVTTHQRSRGQRRKLAVLFPVADLSSGMFITKHHFCLVDTQSIISGFSGRRPNVFGNLLLSVDLPLLLNYDKGYLEFLNPSYDLSGFYPVKVRFGRRHAIYITLLLFGKETEFLFDPGNVGVNLIKSVDRKSWGQPQFEYCSTIWEAPYKAVSFPVNAYFNKPVALSKKLEVLINVSEQKDLENNMGQAFIKKFNWIIDARKKKMYCKVIDSTIFEKQQLPVISQMAGFMSKGRLSVQYAMSGKSKYHCGQEIVSINKVKIDSLNASYYLKVLNTTADWNDLSVEVR